jgi:peptide/nickel transport system permease protein
MGRNSSVSVKMIRFVIMAFALAVTGIIFAITGAFIGGQVLVESVFNIPGMGVLLLGSVFNRDFLVTQGVTVIVAGAVIVVNLFVDIAYGWFDPRIRYR